MTAPIESIAVMTDPAAADDDTPPAVVETRPSAPLQAATAAAGARTVSPNAMLGLLGTLLVAALGAMIGLVTWQISSLSDRIDAIHRSLDAKIDRIDAKIDAVEDRLNTKIDSKIDSKIDGLRAEMQAGFREVNATLLDHTERLARLETTVGSLLSADDEASGEESDPEP